MSPGRSLSRDLLTAKTTSAKAQKIKNSTRNRLFLNKPVPEWVAVSELSNGTKEHTSKSRETIPLTYDFTCGRQFLKAILTSKSIKNL
jgi:hypothetical protein